MTKVGEGDTPRQASIQSYQNDVDQSTLKFQNAFESYQITSDSDQRARLKAIMDQQVLVLRAAVRELKLQGIYKQEVKVEADYQAFLSSNGSSESQAALLHDLQTLRDYNALSRESSPQQ